MRAMTWSRARSSASGPDANLGTGNHRPRLASIRMMAAAALAAATLVTAPAPAQAASCQTGPYQRQAESYLGLKVDGVNSSADCDKIKAFQAKNEIVPAAGYAGSVTYSVMKRKTSARSRASMCPALSRVVCVDLTSQMMWIAESGKPVWGPYAIRSGRNGYETRTTTNRGGDCRSKYSTGSADYCKVFRRVRDDWSYTWNSPMPYAMYFDGGQAFHTSTRYMYSEPGSHGCIHMLPGKASWLWGQMPLGTKVFIFGRKPGT